ncbi:MAG: hypothetical protein JNK78_05010 [Planctomycetes bacterium]|nr:hypothetical protein [Planctomycetota bacterium]
MFSLLASPFAAGAAAVIFVVVAAAWLAARRSIVRSLPTPVRVLPMRAVDLLPATRDAVDGLARLGFVPLGEAQVPNLVPAPVVLPFVHRERGMLAAIRQFGGARPHTVTEFETRFACGVTLSTSSAGPSSLPLPPHCFLQMGDGGSVAALLERHQEGVASLRAMGRRTRSTAAVTLGDFVHRMVTRIREQRELFERAPARTTALLLWRTLFGRGRHARPLHEQVGADSAPVLAPAR